MSFPDEKFQILSSSTILHEPDFFQVLYLNQSQLQVASEIKAICGLFLSFYPEVFIASFLAKSKLRNACQH